MTDELIIDIEDDRTPARRRKRCGSSNPALLEDTQPESELASTQNHGHPTPPATPHRSKKRARFSDPGQSSSTGLTPILSRNSFSSPPPSKARQHPFPSSRSSSRSNLLPDNSTELSETLQFLQSNRGIRDRDRRGLRRRALSEVANARDLEKRLREKNRQKDEEIAFWKNIANQINVGGVVPIIGTSENGAESEDYENAYNKEITFNLAEDREPNVEKTDICHGTPHRELSPSPLDTVHNLPNNLAEKISPDPTDEALDRNMDIDNIPLQQNNLFAAATRGDQMEVQRLLDRHDVDPDSKRPGSVTPLISAAKNGREAVVRLLLGRCDVNPDSKDNAGHTPLWYAAESGHHDVARLLLDRSDVDPNVNDDYVDGRTPLMIAVENGHEGVAELLLGKSNVDLTLLDRSGNSPLQYAASFGRVTVVDLLLGRDDVDPNQECNGLTPLMLAARNGHEAVVELLLGWKGVKADIRGSPSGETALTLAAKEGHEVVMQRLLEKDSVNPNFPNGSGDTALWCAVQSGHFAAVKVLLQKDVVDASIKNANGRTVLWWSAYSGCSAIVELLLERDNINPNEFNDDVTPLMAAARNGHEAVVQLLLGWDGIKPGIKDSFGWTALRIAASKGHDGIVRLLLDRDSSDIYNALLSAADGGHEAVVLLLLKHGVAVERIKYTLRMVYGLPEHHAGHEAVIQLLYKYQE